MLIGAYARWVEWQVEKPHDWMFSLSPYPQLRALSWIHVKLHVLRIQGCFITLPVFFVAMTVLESKARPWIQISGSHRFWKMMKFGQYPLGFILCQISLFLIRLFFFFLQGDAALNCLLTSVIYQSSPQPRAGKAVGSKSRVATFC